MKTARVWFNHWFSTAYHIINLLRDDDEFDFTIIGTNHDGSCVYKTVCDEWETEPYFSKSDDYIDFALEFCKRKRIDVFLPRRNMLAVSRRLTEFEKIGVNVLVERDYGLMSALNDKVKTYELFERYGIGSIPPYRIVKSTDEFEAAYRELKTDDNRVCFKFASDEGAVSFRVVDNKIEYNLAEPIGAKISYADAVLTLNRMTPFLPLLVMPYLPGEEISVDCLYMPDGNHIAIPRYKGWRRSEEIKYDDGIIGVSNRFMDTFKLQFPCNLQFKSDKGVPYILEVNTRMSGGVQLSCMAAGVNIPSIAVNRLLGVEKTASYNKDAHLVTFIETPIIL
jgi:hypothetical protein